jgi:hypothetical protein
MPNMNNARLIKDLQRFQEAAPKWIGYLQAQNSGVAAGATTTPGGTGSRNGRQSAGNSAGVTGGGTGTRRGRKPNAQTQQ